MTTITRRAALSGISWLTVAPGAAALPARDFSLAELEELIRQYEKARSHNEAVRDRFVILDNRMAAEGMLRPTRVQVGNKFQGFDEDGKTVSVPIYAYSVDGVKERYRKNLQNALSMFGQHEAARQSILARHDSWLQSKLNELEEQFARRKRYEDEIGFTEVSHELDVTDDIVMQLQERILSFVPATLAAAARLAGWFVAEVEDVDGPSRFDEDDFLACLRGIAAAAATTVSVVQT